MAMESKINPIIMMAVRIMIRFIAKNVVICVYNHKILRIRMILS